MKLIAYWWETPTDVQADANMSLECKDVKGISIPCLVNHKEIPPYTKLCKFVKKPASMKVVSITDKMANAKKKPRLSK